MDGSSGSFQGSFSRYVKAERCEKYPTYFCGFNCEHQITISKFHFTKSGDCLAALRFSLKKGLRNSRKQVQCVSISGKHLISERPSHPPPRCGRRRLSSTRSSTGRVRRIRPSLSAPSWSSSSPSRKAQSNSWSLEFLLSDTQYGIPNLTCCVCTLGTTLVRLCNVFLVRVVPVGVREPSAGPADSHHGLQDLQECPRSRQQGRRGTPVQGKDGTHDPDFQNV